MAWQCHTLGWLPPHLVSRLVFSISLGSFRSFSSLTTTLIISCVCVRILTLDLINFRMSRYIIMSGPTLVVWFVGADVHEAIFLPAIIATRL